MSVTRRLLTSSSVAALYWTRSPPYNLVLYAHLKSARNRSAVKDCPWTFKLLWLAASSIAKWGPGAHATFASTDLRVPPKYPPPDSSMPPEKARAALAPYLTAASRKL